MILLFSTYDRLKVFGLIPRNTFVYINKLNKVMKIKRWNWVCPESSHPNSNHVVDWPFQMPNTFQMPYHWYCLKLISPRRECDCICRSKITRVWAILGRIFWQNSSFPWNKRAEVFYQRVWFQRKHMFGRVSGSNARLYFIIVMTRETYVVVRNGFGIKLFFSSTSI